MSICEQSPLLKRLRIAALKRGATGIRSLSLAFRCVNDNNNEAVDSALSHTTIGPEEAKTGFGNWGVHLTDEDVNELISCLDTNGDGRIDINEFLKALRGGMSAPRKAIVDKAFDTFDYDGSDLVTIDDLHNRSGGNEALLKFLSAFDSETNPDGKITRNEFHEYYAGVSGGIDNDAHFISMVQTAWNITSPSSTKPTTPTNPDQYGTFGEGHTYQRYYSTPDPVRCFIDFRVDGLGCDRVLVDLFNDKCPITSENFRALCTGEKGKGLSGMPLHYKGLSMHRISNGSFIQGGDVARDNGKGSDSIYGTRFKDENFAVKHAEPFMLTMANTGPNSNGSQFCITLKPLPYLDGRNVAFGKVVSNTEWVKEIAVHCASDTGEPHCRIEIQDCGVLK